MFRLIKSIKNDKIDIYIILLVAVIFSMIWYYIDLLRFLSFNAYLYDLGTQTSSLISLTHTTTFHSFLVQITPTRPIMVMFVPIIMAFPTVKTLLLTQALFIGLSSVPLYAIAKHYSKRIEISAAITAAYLLFFPLNRLIYFDFHYMALFPLPFFIGYYLYLKKSKWFLLFFFLSSLFDIALAVAPVLITLSGIFGLIIHHLKNEKINPQSWRGFPLPTYVASLLLLSFVFAFYIYMTSVGSLVSFGSSSGSSVSLIQTFVINAGNAFNKGAPILFLSFFPLIPFILSPIKNWKIGYVMIPFIVMFFISGYPFWLFNAQYMGAFLSPLLFVMVSGLFWEDTNTKLKPGNNIEKTKKSYFVLSNRKRNILNAQKAFVFLALVILISVFYAPWGPLNSSSASTLGHNYNSYANFQGATTLTHTEKMADKLFSMVPENKTVLVQDNMPILSVRDRNYMFGPGMLPWLNSTGVSYTTGPIPKSTIPDYIALDTESWFTNWFYNSTDGTMQYWFTYFYEHYHYGLLGYDYPFALYKLNFTGNPIMMTNVNMPVNEVHNLTYPLDNKYTTYPVVSKPFLFPGRYSAFFNITITSIGNNNSNNELDFTVAHIGNGSNSYAFAIPKFNESEIGKNMTILLNFTIDSPAFAQYLMNSYNFNGSVIFRGGDIKFMG